MTRAQLEHLIAAASSISEDDEIIIVGSQSILGRFPDAPPELLVSTEADLYPRHFPDRADLVAGSIGELSPFHDTFGYYAQGVGEETSTLPRDWQSRLVPVKSARTRGATGWCLEPHDLVIAKAFAGREKDQRFIEAAARHSLVDLDTLRARLAATEGEPELHDAVAARLERWCRPAAHSG